MQNLIEIRNLSVAYDNEIVLKDVQLDVREKDFLGIIGPNGGGKTTLLKAILGLEKPVKGSIRFPGLGKDVQKSIGYLPQFHQFDKRFPIQVREVVLSGLMDSKRLMASCTKNQKNKADRLLEEMGVAGIRSKAIGELSGGQMQRVFLCRALISDPQVLILDEPDTFVDNRFESELYQKLRELNEHMAIILVSHDVGTITYYIKTIACVNKELHYHPSNRITEQQLASYNCPMQIIAHGDVPHTILKKHQH